MITGLGFGQLIVFWSTAIGGAIDKLIAAFTREMAAPMWLGLVAWYIFTAWRFYAGDVEGEAKSLFRRSIGMFFVVAFATSVPLITKYIKDVYWVGLPKWLSRITASAGLGDPDAAVAASLGLTLPGNFGTDLDVIFAHVWRSVAVVWKGLGTWDVFGYIACIVTVLSGVAQCLLAITAYIVADFMTGALVGMAALFLGLALFDYTRPFFDRYIGKLASLVLVKVVIVVITQMVVQSDLIFLEMIRNAPASEGVLQSVRTMIWVVIVMCTGLVVTAGAGLLAYQLGGAGGAPSFMPSLPGGGRSSGGGKSGGGLMQSLASGIQRIAGRSGSGSGGSGSGTGGRASSGSPSGGRGSGSSPGSGGSSPAKPTPLGSLQPGRISQSSAPPPALPRPAGS